MSAELQPQMDADEGGMSAELQPQMDADGGDGTQRDAAGRSQVLRQ